MIRVRILGGISMSGRMGRWSEMLLLMRRKREGEVGWFVYSPVGFDQSIDLVEDIYPPSYLHNSTLNPFQNPIIHFQQLIIHLNSSLISACSATGLFNLPVSSALLTFSIFHNSISVCVSSVHVPICGSSSTFGLSIRPGWIWGSFS